MNKARILLLTRVVPAALLLAGAAQAQSITKCQDAEGNWHYGDFASAACAEESTITEIDERGQLLRETDAPPTEDELAARKAAEEQELEEAERRSRQAAEDRRLLQTYDSAEAIIDARDKRLTAVEQELKSHRLFRQDLVDERQKAQNDGDSSRLGGLNRQIEQYDAAIQQLEQERRNVMDSYDQDLERYTELVD